MPKMECEHCAKPGDKSKDFIVAIGPDGKIAWWARKDCPDHGVREIFEDQGPNK